MEFRRHSRKSATAPAVTPASQPGCPMDDDVDQTVDSRAYAFAYLVQEPLQLPADFPLDEDFDYALFLPQELVPRFETPRYVPRLLLEGADRLSVYAHPSCGSRNTTILFGEISHIKLDRFLRFFVPPQELIKSGLFRQQFSWTFGSEVVLTRKELHLFSDDKDGYRQLYGFRASWAPIRNVTDIRWDDVFRSVAIRLRSDLSLKVPVPIELREEAEKFVRFAVELITLRKSN